MQTVITVLSVISLIYLMLFIMMKSTEESRTNTQNEKTIKVGTNPEKSQNQKEDKINNQNRIKDSEPLIEDTIKKFLQQQERQIKKLILKKLMNLEMLQDNIEIH